MRVLVLIAILLLTETGFSQEYPFYKNGLINRLFEEDRRELVIKNLDKTDKFIQSEKKF